MLADDAVLELVLSGDDGLIAWLAPGSLHISMSTIALATADLVAARHQDHGQRYIRRPVFGRPEAAAAGNGPPGRAARRRRSPGRGPCSRRLASRSSRSASARQRRTWSSGRRESPHPGGDCPGRRGTGAGRERRRRQGEAARSADRHAVRLTRAHRTYGPILAKRSSRPARIWRAPLGLKDMRLVGEAAEKSVTPMPLPGLLRDRLLDTIAKRGPTSTGQRSP